MESSLRDLRYACRAFGRTPGFALVVIATLAMVIGANVTMFSVMHAVLWRGLPYPDADRLVLVDADAGGVARAGLAGAEARDLVAEPGLFDRLATIVRVDAHVIADDNYEHVPAASATDDALELLGALPLAYGRGLEAARDAGTAYVRSVVISHDLWRRRFNADPAAIGRHVEINNLDVEIVGVLRPEFRVFLPANAALPEVVDVWFPRGFEGDRRSRSQATVARLAPGVSVAAAATRLDVLSRRLAFDHAADYPSTPASDGSAAPGAGPLRLTVRPLHDVLTADSRLALWMLAGAVSFVLLIGCVNVGNLMLSRARTRAREMAVRRALGAAKSRMVVQLFTEAAVLAAIGALAGFLLANGGVALVEWLRPAHLPRQSQIAINGTVALYTAALSVIVTVIFGLVPVLGGTEAGHDALKAGRVAVQRSGTRRLQRLLVISEVALSIIPLVAAGLMLRTFVNLTNAPIGFNPEGLQTAKIAYSARLLPDPKTRLQLHRDALERVRRLPGVDDVSAASPLPFDEYQFVRKYGRADEAAALSSLATMQSVFPGYLGITRTPLRAGRDFVMDDIIHRRFVVIVDERIANQLWPAPPTRPREAGPARRSSDQRSYASEGGPHAAIGQRLAVSRGRSSALLEVIGVTHPVRATHVRDDSMPHIFVPYHFFELQMALVVKTGASATAIGPSIKRVVESLGTRRPVYDIRPMTYYVDRSMSDTRFTMLVLIGFAAASLLLAALGLYGTLAYLTSQRTQEFGVRMALGATASRVLSSVIGEGAVLAVWGGAIGLAGAAGMTGAIRGLLYDVAPFDIASLAGVAGVVAVVSIAAAAHPAWRAARVDPVTALRAE